MACEKKPVSLVIKENIEMKVFSSKELCKVVITQEEEEEHSFYQRYIECPDCEQDPELQVQTQPRPQAKLKTTSPGREEPLHSVVVPKQKIEIELEVFPPITVSKSQLAKPSLNKAGCLKWKRLIPQKKRLVVKDVVCLPRGHCMSQLDRQIAPQSKEQAGLAAMGVTARITIDSSWSATQVQSRLAMLFQGHFVKQAGQTFSFTYLQCMQGSRVLFVPDTPAEGWTGEQVLRISGHGALYILSHHDYSETESEQSASETPVVKSTESCHDGKSQLVQIQPRICKDTEKSTVNLDTILRMFRQENVDRGMETYIQVRTTDLLHSALEVVRRPDFCFRLTPIISFSGEETDGHEAPLREFFRLTLLELQDSCVFEGLPGRLFLTCNLIALEERKYYEAGVLIGWSLAQGGPGPCCLHPALYQVMCHQSPTLEDFDWRDIVDAEAQIRLKELHSCTDVKLLSPSLCEWVSCCGIPEICSARSDEIPAIYSRLVKHYIYHRVASMISQFTEGLNSCGGLWDMVQSHWEIFVSVMTRTRWQPLTLEEFKQLFTICFSCLDSQLRAAEEATAGHWETVLNLVGDGKAEFSFEDLLAFITGADHLPPLGLSRLISLCFYSQDANMPDVRLPHASTCSLELYLPRGVAGAVDLLALLNRAVHEALGNREDN